METDWRVGRSVGWWNVGGYFPFSSLNDIPFHRLLQSRIDGLSFLQDLGKVSSLSENQKFMCTNL